MPASGMIVGSRSPDLASILALAPDRLGTVDIAIRNLCCAEGLPGAERLDVAACLRTLERWARAVGRYARDARGDYQRDPDRYGRQRGYFNFLCMATLLKQPRAIGVRYQPTAIGNTRFGDSRDDLLHGLLTRKLGTCASLPALFVAIARRLRWPLYLAVAKQHVFCQWVNDDGSRVNCEGSCGGGAHRFDDAYYHGFPRRMTAEDLASGRYLRPLTAAEETAIFLETRGHCLVDNRRFDEARAAYAQAHRVAPAWSQYADHLYGLEGHARIAAGVRRGLVVSHGSPMRLTINGPVTGRPPLRPTGYVGLSLPKT